MSRPASPRTHWFTWRHIRFKLLERPDNLGQSDAFLQLTAIAPCDMPAPIMKPVIVATTALTAAGGAVAFIEAELNRASATRTYRNAEFLWRQGDLFHSLPPEEKDHA